MEVPYGVHEMNDPLLARDTADEQDIWPLCIDPELPQHRRVGSGAIPLQIDAVVNHPHPVEVDSVCFVRVTLHRFRHGDHAVG